MATKVKPCRIKATGTPQVGYVPKYVDEDTFQWGAGGGGGGSDIEYVTQAEYNALLPGALTDGKHYFIYSTSGGGWQPGANTIAYYPLTSQTTVNNQVSGGTNLTNVNVVFGTANGVDCATISGNSISSIHDSNCYLYGNITGLPTGANPRTFCFWCYNDNATTPSTKDETYIYQGQSYTNNMVFVFSGMDAGGGYGISSYGPGSPTYSPILRQQRCHNVIVYDGAKFVWYLNGTEIISWTYTINTGSNYLSIGGLANGVDVNWNAFNGSFSRLIIEDKGWTAQEVADYYNQTKSIYGIS